MKLLAALACCLGVAASPGAMAATEPPVVKACGHHDYPPWNWSREGRIVGACAVVAQRAIERLGYKVDLTYVGPWKRCQAMVQSGEVDVNICSFRNPEREGYSRFVEPRIGQNRIAVFMRKDKAQQLRFSRWDDLAGLRTGLVTGVSMGADFDRFLEQKTHVERTTSVASVLKMMSLDRVDIVPFGWEAGTIEIERNGFTGRIVPLAQPALVGDLFVSVSRKSPLAARTSEIAQYFLRPGYGEELRGLLDEFSRQYLQEK
ncbi:MAG TPA: transporter substrate-binding domain-containing protein [Albitalea sp.]|uniref:substrate-binding periplasmic protein n=1 Tax=Piscinibacter sp. TaxID=1903157 RepID=UPI002ED53163